MLDRYSTKVKDRHTIQTGMHSLCYVSEGLQKTTTVFSGDRQTVWFCVQTTEKPVTNYGREERYYLKTIEGSISNVYYRAEIQEFASRCPYCPAILLPDPKRPTWKVTADELIHKLNNPLTSITTGMPYPDRYPSASQSSDSHHYQPWQGRPSAFLCKHIHFPHIMLFSFWSNCFGRCNKYFFLHS